jgi:hypothetical protein
MQEDYRIRARSNVMTLTRTRAGLPGNQIGAYCDVALREFWSLSGHGGHWSSRTDQARLMTTRSDPLYGSPHWQTRSACKAGDRGLP